ncbi:CAMK family protein kinase [Tritrichomonas foetus]|uniref:CAMK family protein kinase n=1 Tax=Tritrichomonas foetus TaxID=1144522 RepID=A0A1J4K3V0_9EUKA|nr:CAMK family protein kinase [Tritrichomonas foetus]|eukprot:OHT05650.1 CAMK family protein kinase [Tritrichomonas foetus]
MGGGSSTTSDPSTSTSYTEFQEHPLLSFIENPINRFCDDFASSLLEDVPSRTTKSDIQVDTVDQEEIYGYTIIKVLGDGAEAIVYEGLKNRTNVPLALKKYKKVLNMGETGVPREYEISKLLNHPNCIKMYDCIKNVSGEFIISMPLGTHGALNYSTVPVLTVSSTILFLKQLGSALFHMHSHNVVHRDIKPGNILLNDDGFVFCDYSVSVHLPSDFEPLSGVVGTSVFMSCEISNNSMYLPKPVDVWALGVTVYVLSLGSFPYKLEQALSESEGQEWNNTAPIQKCVNQNDLEFPDVPVLPNELKEVIGGMLEKDPMKRWTAQMIAENEWLNEKCEEWLSILSFMESEDSESSME